MNVRIARAHLDELGGLLNPTPHPTYLRAMYGRFSPLRDTHQPLRLVRESLEGEHTPGQCPITWIPDPSHYLIQEWSSTPPC